MGRKRSYRTFRSDIQQFSIMSVIDSNTFTISSAIDIGPSSLLDIHLNTSLLTNEILDHGCFCSKLEGFNTFQSNGGHIAIDDVDQTCQNWIKQRECSGNFEGGSCYENSNQVLTYNVVQDIFDDGAKIYDCSGNTDQCAYESCIIDVEYVLDIEEMMDTIPQFVHSPVSDDGSTCPISFDTPNPNTYRVCNGTAPNLFTSVQESTPAGQTILEIVANNADLTDTVSCGDYRDEDGCTVEYYTTSTKVNWSNSQIACRDMGLDGLAEVRDTTENACFETLPAGLVWLGGYRQNKGDASSPWIWVTSGKTATWGNFISNSGAKHKDVMIIWKGYWPQWDDDDGRHSINAV